MHHLPTRSKQKMRTYNKIGIMQGRLLPPLNNAIQAFPKENWQKEFPIASKLNLDCIEFIFDGEDYSFHPLMTTEGLQEIKRLEKENNIQVLSVCADYFMSHPIHSNNLERRKQNIEILKNLIYNCAKLNVSDIIIPCVDNSSLKNKDDKDLFKSGILECLQVAEDCNLNLTLETDLAPLNFKKFMQEFSSKNLKINYDTGNSASLGYDPETELQSYGKWITDIHIKDRIFGGSTVPLGEGNTNFPLIFQLLKNMNYKGIFILQTARKKQGDEIETIKQYLDLIAKYQM